MPALWRAGSLVLALACAAGPRVVAAAPASESAGGPLLPALEVRAMTLAEALEFARSHQPDLMVVQERLRAAEVRLEVPRAGWLPQVGAMAQLNAGTSNNSTAVIQAGGGVALSRIGGTPQTIPPSFAPHPSTVLAVGLRQNVYDFGRIAAETAVADALLDLERRRGDEVGFTVALAVEQAFFAVLAARAVRDAAEGAWRRAQLHLEATQAGLDRGLRNASDLARAEADVARFELGLVRAQGGLRAAQGLLAATIGAEEPAIDAVGSFADEPEAAAAAYPFVRTAAAELRVQEARTEALRRELRPTLFFGASFSGRAGGIPASNGTVPYGRGWLPAVPNWDVGLVFSAPLYDGVVRARRRAALAEERVSRARVAAAERQQTIELRAAQIQLEVAQQAEAPLERARAAAENNLRAAEARYKQGLGSALEVSDAAAQLVDAEVQLALGRFDIARNRARVRALRGAP